MPKVKAVRGLIYSKFNSEAEFAHYLGWKKQKLSKITNGQKQPDLQEVSEMSKALGIGMTELTNIFLSQKSPIA